MATAAPFAPHAPSPAPQEAGNPPAVRDLAALGRRAGGAGTGHARSATEPPFLARDPFWLGRQLVKDGLVTEEQFASAVRRFRNAPTDSFEHTLEMLALADQQTIARYLADAYGLPFAALASAAVMPETASLLQVPRARAAAVVPIDADEGSVTLAVADPRRYTPRDAERDFPGRAVRFVVAPRGDILAAIDLAAAPTTAADPTPKERLRAILTEAVKRGASDVHLEVQPAALVVRYRIDNTLIHVDHLEPAMRSLLVQAAKTAANIDLAEKRLPQDGSGKFQIGSQTYTFRLSTVPTHQGEDATLRIQSEGSRVMGLADLGLRPDTIATFQRIMAEPHGVLYVTGPTGSGKTTLLYSLLASENTAEEKIITLEDPIEIVVPAYRQIQIDDSIGLTFARALRAVVRQDPDRILLGETRDLESAQIVIQSALTGHKAYSTLHTNDAPSTIARLVDIGVEPYLVASALSGVAACRLVRRLCPHCREAVKGARREAIFAEFGEGNFYEPVGCPKCSKGFRGRIAIAEVYPVTSDEIQSLILRRAPVHELRREFTRLLQLPNLRDDGLAKAREGITSLGEVLAGIANFSS